MADRTISQDRTIYGGGAADNRPISSFIRQVQLHAPNYSAQAFGFLALLISGGFLLLLTGVTVTVSVLVFIAFLPLIIIFSPVWVPLFVFVTGVLSFAGFVFGTAGVVSWMYRYMKGMHPVGSDQVDYARTRIYDTAKEYGGFFHSKLKDAAPGA